MDASKTPAGRLINVLGNFVESADQLSQRVFVLECSEMSIRAEAERCAGSLPVGMFGIDDIAIAISVIELGFRLWQSCSSASNHTEAVAAAGMTRESKNFRRARRRVYVAAKRNQVDLSAPDLDRLTEHMLNHVTYADAVSVGVCCQEPRIQDEIND